MDFINFIRVPFVVEAAQITDENFAEMAALLGEVKTKGDSTFIALDRRVVPNINRAYVGWWVTRFGDNLRCYSPKVFLEQFTILPEDGRYVFIHEEDEEEDVPA